MAKPNPKQGKPQGKQQGKRKLGGKPGAKPPYKTGEGSKQERRLEETADTAAAMSRENPIRLYTKYEQFAHDAARVSFARPLGTKFQEVIVDGSDTVHTTNRVTPGIMRILFSPAVGVSDSVDSPLNRSSINFYARLRSTQKAFGDYDHQDATMMMIGIDSAIMFHALGRRIYGLLRDMTPTNKYYSEMLITASGVDFHATIREIQDFRAWLNEFALRIEQYALPKNILLFDRHQWMCEGIYTDGTAKRAQTYIFVPAGFWKYNGTAENGSQLDYVQYINPATDLPGVGVTPMTLQAFMDIGDSLIAAMSNDADFATISGDLYAYYGGDVYKLPYIEETYQILPSYDETVLAQIENAMIAGPFAETYTPVISQTSTVNNGAIMFQPVVQFPATTYDAQASYRVLSTPSMNFHVDTPSEDLVIEATRLMLSFGSLTSSAGTPTGRYIARCGTEIVHAIDIISKNATTGVPSYFRINRPMLSIKNNSTAQQISYITMRLLQLVQFDWAPRVGVDIINAAVTPTSIQYGGDTWDRETTDNIADSKLDTITTACLYSLFNIETR